MREKDIILSACGVGEYGEPKGCVTVNFARWHMEEQREEVVKRLFTNEPVINITRTPRLTMVDLTFEMGEDSDFHELLEVLRMSSEPENTFDGEEDVMPTLYVTIMPYAYEMEYFLTGLHAVWCLMPSVADGGIDTVRLIFNNELFSVYQVDGEVLDALQDVYLNDRNTEDGDSVDYGDCMDCADYADEVSENDEAYEDHLDYTNPKDKVSETDGDYGDFRNKEEDGKQRQKSYERIVKMIAIMIGLIGAGIIGAVSGLWDYLWGLLLWYLFRKRKVVWHGILTEEENRFIQIVPASEDFRLAQEIIDYSSDPMEAYGMLEETGDATYLPKFCKVWVSFLMNGETQIQRLRCDERQVHEFMENLGDVGDKRVLIESRAAEIEIRLVYP